MKKLRVNEEACIGCGACTAICNEVFEINEEGLATVIVDIVPKDVEEDALDAKEGCPTGAIVEVEDVKEEEIELEASIDTTDALAA